MGFYTILLTTGLPDLRIETPRLILRTPVADDFEPFFAMMQDPSCIQFLTFDQKPMDRGICWRTFAAIVGHWCLKGFGFFTAIDKQTGAYIGRVGPWYPEGWPHLEIGWAIAPEFRGKGYAQEAAIGAAFFAFRELEVPHVIHFIRPENANSRKVAEALGAVHASDSVLFGQPTEIWRLTEAAFRAGATSHP